MPPSACSHTPAYSSCSRYAASPAAEVAELTSHAWELQHGQLGCQLSGNYLNFDGSVTYDEEAYERYLTGFFEPVGKAVVDAWRAERAGAPATDFNAVVRRLLEE